jgi:fatty acid-binding protein DegV
MSANALMVDSSCNLSIELMDSLGIICVPNQLQIGANLLADDRDTQRALQFFQSDFDNGKVAAEIIPAAPEAYLQTVREHAAMQCDNLLILAPLRDLSKLYENANKGLVSVASACLEVRKTHGRKEIMRVDVDDSRNLFSPHGLVAWEAALAIRSGMAMPQVRKHVAAMAAHTMGYYAVRNVKYIYNRARDSRDKPNALLFAVGSVLDVKPIVRRQGMESVTVAKVRGFEAAAQRTFDRITGLIEENMLIVPRIVVSYSGDLQELQALPGFARMMQAAVSAKVKIASSVMSLSGGVFMGAGSLAIGIAAKPHSF